jgi:hypothetical protein
MGSRLSAPVQTDAGAHPASCTIGTGFFPGVECGRGVTMTPHSLRVPRSKNRVALYLFISRRAFVACKKGSDKYRRREGDYEEAKVTNLFSCKIHCSNAKWLHSLHHIKPVDRSVSGDDCFPKWGSWRSSSSLPESLTERKWGLVDVTAAVALLLIRITPPPYINQSMYTFNHTCWVTTIYSEITYLRAYTLFMVFIPLEAHSL